MDIDDPVALLLVAAAALEQAGLPAAAYGGLVLGMYGEPRETRDADLAVAGVDIERAQAALGRLNVHVTIAFSEVRFGGCSLSRLSLIGGDQLNTVDLVVPRSARYARQVLERGLTGSLRGQSLLVVCPEDFVILKVLSTRERDLEDALSVWKTQAARLDVPLIRAEIDQLVEEITDHEIRERFERVQP